MGEQARLEPADWEDAPDIARLGLKTDPSAAYSSGFVADLLRCYDCVWDDAERNTIDEIVCRVHPKGADAIEEFWAWFEPQKEKWLGPHRACGAWLADEVGSRR